MLQGPRSPLQTQHPLPDRHVSLGLTQTGTSGLEIKKRAEAGSCLQKEALACAQLLPCSGSGSVGIGSLLVSMAVSVTALERGDKTAARGGQPLCLKNNTTCLPSEFAAAHKTTNSANSLAS